MDGDPIKIPRRAVLDDRGRMELHVFVDASKEAYAAAVYLRCDWNGRISSHLILSKNRVRPRSMAKDEVKAKAYEMTIPRMELMAMLIGTRLLTFAEK